MKEGWNGQLGRSLSSVNFEIKYETWNHENPPWKLVADFLEGGEDVLLPSLEAVFHYIFYRDQKAQKALAAGGYKTSIGESPGSQSFQGEDVRWGRICRALEKRDFEGAAGLLVKEALYAASVPSEQHENLLTDLPDALVQVLGSQPRAINLLRLGWWLGTGEEYNPQPTSTSVPKTP